MLASIYIEELLMLLQHGIGGPMGFALRFCGHNSDAVSQILRLDSLLITLMTPLAYIKAAIWIFLTLGKKAGVPRWTILFYPLLTGRLDFALVYVPAPLSLPLYDGWWNIIDIIWFAVLALTYMNQEVESSMVKSA
jgi:hypothetical protein